MAESRSQADEYRMAVAVSYPGYSPTGPYHLPLQNGVWLDHGEMMKDTAKWNRGAAHRFGIKKEMTEAFLVKPIQLMYLDAFWWFFLQHFAAVDFDSMVQRTRTNVLTTDAEMMTYLNSIDPTAVKRPQAKSKKTLDKNRHQRRQLPEHLTPTRGKIRQLEDVVRIGTPSAPTPTKLAESFEHSRDIISPESGSPASSARSETSLSATSSVSNFSVATTADGVMRVAVFATTYPSLKVLNDEVRSQVIAREQHQLFTRMSEHYSLAVQGLLSKHHTVKDSITRLLPDYLAQALYMGFYKALPYASHLLDLQFQHDLHKHLSLWIGGVESVGQPRNWPIHRLLNTVYKRERPRKTEAEQRRLAQQRERMKNSLKMKSTSLFSDSSSFGVSLPSLQPSPQSARGLGGFVPPAKLMAQTTPTGKSRKSLDTRSQTDTTTSFIIPSNSPEARKLKCIRDEMKAFDEELSQFKRTHGFALFHYTAVDEEGKRGMHIPKPPQDKDAPAGTSTTGIPSRIAGAVKGAVPKKRTVHVIKEELDAKFREGVPWYGNPKHRIPIKEQVSNAKFALENWSPLMHRFLLIGGHENNSAGGGTKGTDKVKANAVSMKWTL